MAFKRPISTKPSVDIKRRAYEINTNTGSAPIQPSTSQQSSAHAMQSSTMSNEPSLAMNPLETLIRPMEIFPIPQPFEMVKSEFQKYLELKSVDACNSSNGQYQQGFQPGLLAPRRVADLGIEDNNSNCIQAQMFYNANANTLEDGGVFDLVNYIDEEMPSEEENDDVSAAKRLKLSEC